MTSTSVPPTPAATRPKASVLLRVAVAISALLAVIDVVGTVPYWNNPMPIEIGLVILAIAIGTFLGTIPAWQGRTWGVWLVIVTRVLSVAMSFPVFVEPDVPASAVLPTVIQVIVTIPVIVLLLIGLRRRR